MTYITQTSPTYSGSTFDIFRAIRINSTLISHTSVSEVILDLNEMIENRVAKINVAFDINGNVIKLTDHDPTPCLNLILIISNLAILVEKNFTITIDNLFELDEEYWEHDISKCFNTLYMLSMALGCSLSDLRIKIPEKILGNGFIGVSK